MTTFNKVSYQNALSASNLPFATACGSLLTNYCWKEVDAAKTIHEALRNDLPLHQVYFGIDVWAQNTTQLSHPRVTYPEYGGGGTNTGVAVAKLAELGLSAGIFAPAWTFEHFPAYGRDVEQTTWDATDLPQCISCSCGDCEKRHQPNKARPITSFARQYSAGSEGFFFTDFNRATIRHTEQEERDLFSGFAMHAQLGSQSVLPLRTESLGMMSPLRHRLEDVQGRMQLVIETHEMPLTFMNNVGTSIQHWVIPLFRLNMPADGSLRLRLSYRDLSNMPQGISFYMKTSGSVINVTTNNTPKAHNLEVVVRDDSLSKPDPRLEEIGFHMRVSGVVGARRLAEVDSICIQHVTSKGSSQTHQIVNVHISPRGEGDARHLRLCWGHSSIGRPVHGMPYSHITGSFSHFTIEIDGLSLGRAYAAEHILTASFVEQMTGREVAAKVTGIGFDGQQLASATTTLRFQSKSLT